jgi:hypothetical protein
MGGWQSVVVVVGASSGVATWLLLVELESFTSAMTTGIATELVLFLLVQIRYAVSHVDWARFTALTAFRYELADARRERLASADSSALRLALWLTAEWSAFILGTVTTQVRAVFRVR